MISRKLLVAVAGIIVLAGVAIVFFITRPARLAKEYLSELGAIEVGKTTDSELSNSAFSRHAIRECRQDHCSYVSRLDNHLLSLLHVSPATELIIAVTEEKGVVSDIWIHGVVGAESTIAMVTAQQHAESANCVQAPCVKMARKSGSGHDLAWATIVYGGNGNQVSTAVNPGCLSKIGGCQNANEFMPMISDAAKLGTGTI